MVNSKMNRAGSNFIGMLAIYRPDNDSTGLSERVVAEWMGKEVEVEVVRIIMPIFGWKKVDIAGEIYWFDPDVFDKFKQRIEGYLARELVYEVLG